MMIRPTRGFSSTFAAINLAAALSLWLWNSSVATALSSSSSDNPLLASNRPKVLNLLNHPLQLQLATGDLSNESFRRLVRDRRAILEGILEGIGSEKTTIDTYVNGVSELEFHDHLADVVLLQAETTSEKDEKDNDDSNSSNLIVLDVTDDSGISQSATALASVIKSNGLVGAATVLRCYSFACDRLLVAKTASKLEDGTIKDSKRDHWLRIHAERWSELAQRCEETLTNDMLSSPSTQESSSLCLSMLYNWIDNEAGTSGIRADLNDPQYASLMESLEELEPGYAASRDKNESFLADVTGKATQQKLQKQAQAKRNAAAAYLAAKQQPKNPAAAQQAAAYLIAKKKAEKAAAYLAAKKKKDQS